VIIGEADPEQIAEVLAGFVIDKTMVVASSELDLITPAKRPRAMEALVQAICDGNIEAMNDQEACGKTPILALMPGQTQGVGKPNFSLPE